MFKKITQIRKPSQKVYQELAPHYPVLSTKALLDKKHLGQILHRLPKMANAPETHYRALYMQAILNFADHIQGLSAFKVPAFDYYGGLLDLNMIMAYESLLQFRKEYPLKQIKPEEMSPKQARWSYAIFTAGLFYGIGNIAASYIITTCDPKGHNIQRWSPFDKSMKHINDHYRYSQDPNNRDSLAARVAPILVYKLMPTAGLDWIAQDKELFEAWLAVIQGDERGGGILAKIILHIWEDMMTDPDAIARLINISLPQDFFEQGEKNADFFQPDKHDDESTIKESIDHGEPKLYVPGSSKGVPLADLDIIGISNIEIGEFFIQWLRIGIKGHGVNINRGNSLAHVIQGGRLAISPEIIQEFMSTNKQLNIKSWQQVQQSLVKNGYAEQTSFSTQKQSTAQKIHLPSGTEKHGTTSRAIVIDATVIFNGTKIPAVSQELNLNVPPPAQSYPSVASPVVTANPNPTT